MPQPYILLLHNKVADMFSALRVLETSRGKIYEEDAVSIAWSFLLEMSRLYMELGEVSYEIFKELERLVTAITLVEVDSWYKNEFLSAISIDILEKTGIIIEFRDYYQYLKMASIPLRHELSCLSKAMGHPVMSVEEGTKKVYEQVNEELPIEYECVFESIDHYKKDYIKGYYNRYGCWPLVDITKVTDAGLLAAHARNVAPTAELITRRYG